MLCFRCGSYNAQDAKECLVCGQSFLEDGQGDEGPSNQGVAASKLKDGEAIGGKYIISRPLGTHAIGSKYLVRRKSDDKIFQLNAVSPHLLQTAKDRTNFESALKKWRKVKHPNFESIVDHAVDESGLPYTVTERIDGLTLAKIIAMKQESGEAFKPGEVVPIIGGLCDALASLKSSTYHGDIRPTNIVVLSDGLKVVGGGLLNAIPLKPFLGAQRNVARTLAYNAPEIKVDGAKVDRRADMFSIAVILCEMCTGIRYEGGVSTYLNEQLARLPQGLESLIRKGLNESPDNREANPGQFFKALDAAVAGANDTAFPQPINQKTMVLTPGSDLGGRGPIGDGAAPPPPPESTNAIMLPDDLETEALFPPALPKDFINDGHPGHSFPPGEVSYEGETVAGPIPGPMPGRMPESIPSDTMVLDELPSRAMPRQGPTGAKSGGKSSGQRRENASNFTINLALTAVLGLLAGGALWGVWQIAKGESTGGSGNAVALQGSPDDSPYVLGPDGKVVNLQGLSLTVPPRALNYEQSVNLTREKIPATATMQPFGSALRVEGPLTLSRDAVVEFPLSKDAESSRHLIWASDENDVFKPLKTSVADGFATARTRYLSRIVLGQALNENAEAAVDTEVKPAKVAQVENADLEKGEAARATFENTGNTNQEVTETKALTPATVSNSDAKAPSAPVVAATNTVRTKTGASEEPQTPTSESNTEKRVGTERDSTSGSASAGSSTADGQRAIVALKGETAGAEEKELKCPRGMRAIKAGRFAFGTRSGDSMRAFDELNARKARTDFYCIDYYEFPNSKKRAPSAGFSWSRARDLCESKGKRLCTEEEWERACKGPYQTRFPYGESYDDEICNVDQGSDAQPLGADQRKRCRSGYTIFAMSGNVEEWTSSSSGNRYVLKGGSASRPKYASRCSARRLVSKGTRSKTIGARCCANPQ